MRNGARISVSQARRPDLTETEAELGRYMHPITFGHYPETMQKLVGSRLPNFTAEQRELYEA